MTATLPVHSRIQTNSTHPAHEGSGGSAGTSACTAMLTTVHRVKHRFPPVEQDPTLPYPTLLVSGDCNDSDGSDALQFSRLQARPYTRSYRYDGQTAALLQS